MSTLLLEGGVAGHLAHLHDNRSMTFNKMAKILSMASNGELEGTEKTDGFNIYLGYQNGEARAARNKTNMREGGMNAKAFAAREFKGGKEVRSAYLDSFDAFEAAVASLTPPEKEAIFGHNGEIFYNTEIMGPGASNVVNYDANVITIHHAGHKRYDPETDKVVNVDTTENSKILDKVIDKFEQATSGKKFSVQRTAFLKLQALDNDSHLKVVLSRLNAAGFEGAMTIDEYIESKIRPIVEEKFNYIHEQLKQDIIDRALKREHAKSLTQIYKGMPNEQKGQIRDFINNSGNLVTRTIWPIEDAIHDFAVEMLRGLESAYILDNKKELERLKSETSQAIKAIQSYSGPGFEEAQDVLVKQLQKIKHLDNINSAAEGFVFEYEGQMYKFTGNFAPINQILGLFKYGRGSVPAIQREETQNIEETEENIPENRIIAIVPGAFKPPHRGHLDMVKHYADLADEVIIMVSKLPRKTPIGRVITTGDAIKVWNIYISNAGLVNVTAVPSPHASPVRAAYEFVGEDAQFGDQVILGTSTKGGDQSRFAKNVQNYAKEGVKVLDPMEYAFKPVGEELNASDFRSALESGDDIERFLPGDVDPEEILAILGFNTNLYEQTEPFQLKMRAKHPPMKKKLIGLGGNKETGGGKGHKRPKMARSESAPPMEEAENVEELEEIASMAGGSVEVGGGPFIGFESEENLKKPKKERKIGKEEEAEEAEEAKEEEELVKEITDYLLNKLGDINEKAN